MIDKLIFEGPINSLSMGNVSVNILKSLYKKKINVLYSPIGQPDLNNYNLTEDFKSWIQSSHNKFLKEYSRNLVTIKNWHLNGSHHFPSDKRYLLTYSEVDGATAEGVNIIKNIDKVFFCGNYSPKVFSDYGVETDTFSLGFDEDSFYKKDKKYFNDGRIQWFLGAKLEKRKKTLEILSLWAKKYGKKQGESYKKDEQLHFLNCQITNPFYDIKAQEAQINQALGGTKYTNIQFFQFLDRESFNDLLNSTQIDLTGLSGGESWNLIPFNISNLGKWSIVLNASGQKTWANSSNSILVAPNGKVDSTDSIFFHRGSPFNSGCFYTWSENEVSKAMDIAVTKATTPNLEGEKLKETFSYDKTVDYVLGKIEQDLNKK